MTTIVFPDTVTHPDGTVYFMPPHPSWNPILPDGRRNDVSDPIRHWILSTVALSGGLPVTGYPTICGTDSSPNTLLFRAGYPWPLEYGWMLGYMTGSDNFTDRTGRTWPKPPLSALKNLIISGDPAGGT